MLFGTLVFIISITLLVFMQDNNKDMPAWLVCEDIFGRIKTELITQAMDTLQEAINSKVIEINGSLMTQPDRSSDTEMRMFIINKLLEEKENIIARYGSHADTDKNVATTPEEVRQRERLRKFLFAVEQISLLMDYSKQFDEWMNDISMQVSAPDPGSVLKNTVKGSNHRIELMNYVLSNRKMGTENILTETEREMIKKAIE